MTYQEKMQDPRWTQFRAAVLEFAQYTCGRCGRYESQVPLQIHHPVYRKGAEPWDYHPWQVECLCIDCHRAEHGIFLYGDPGWTPF